MQDTAIIIGAGPAGLTAAYELLRQGVRRPVIFEASGDIGGISRTAHYRGNRMDIGGHRFFSKSDRVMRWWLERLPLQGAPARDDQQLGRAVDLAETLFAPYAGEMPGPDPEADDRVMLVRRRVSRILYGRKFFDYPLSFNAGTLRNIGAGRLLKIIGSYARAKAAPIRPERSLEDFLINHFGRELYRTFFRDYTEKVWGVPCEAIAPEWGAQRIKGLSITKTIAHALDKLVARPQPRGKTETSLIEQFLYPKYGPGQLWETVADLVVAGGGAVCRHQRVVGLTTEGARVMGVEVEDMRTGARETHAADVVFSSMPVRDLIRGMEAPDAVREVAEGLCYRDFITVGLLLQRLALRNTTDIPTVGDIIPDNWLYIQEPDVKLGRIQLFNNWSPYLVADPASVWLGLEYFCAEGDGLWRQPDADLIRFALDELAQLGIADPDALVDATVIRVPKAYPAYFGSYDRFDRIRAFTDRFENLFLIGRNGMHRYNNMDHSMLTAMAAVDAVRNGSADKAPLWEVNAEEAYHEAK